LRLARHVENFGVEAVFGRKVLHEYEMQAMRIASTVVDAFRSRERSKDWVEWDKTHPGLSETLAWAAFEYEKMKNA